MDPLSNVSAPDEILAMFRDNFIESFYRMDPELYYHDHQGNVGTFIIEKVNKKQLRCLLHTPYPPDFWYGALYGSMKRFCPSFIVHYEDIAMRNYDTSQTIVIHMIVE